MMPNPGIKYPLLRPEPPKFSQLAMEVSAIEDSGIYSNYGPVNQRTERALIDLLFGGEGHCLTTCNATIGLILAIRASLDRHFGSEFPSKGDRKYAILPSFTFAATAHAAIWNNLIPLFCDIDPDTWQPSIQSQRELLERYGHKVALLLPYATFGVGTDLAALGGLASEFEIPMALDAAASLGSSGERGLQFGTGSTFPLVFSMHVTKTFSTGEGGLIYSTDREHIDTMRCMGNFGFGEQREAEMLGLNSKLTELGALLVIEKLKGLNEVVKRRQEIAAMYREFLPEMTYQQIEYPNAYQFMPALLPLSRSCRRSDVLSRLERAGIRAGTYFSPHLAEHPYFKRSAEFFDLSVTEEIASRVISLSIYDGMQEADVRYIATEVRKALTD